MLTESVIFILTCNYLLAKNRHVPIHENIQHNQGQNIGGVKANPFGEGYARARIRLPDEIVPAPTITAGAEG